ncbi:MAG: hypothetical protein J0M33_13765 [Anaerolineae bacterium]|nr:hypothetical protein [Anaerolineae bacterium]
MDETDQLVCGAELECCQQVKLRQTDQKDRYITDLAALRIWFQHPSGCVVSASVAESWMNDLTQEDEEKFVAFAIEMAEQNSEICRSAPDWLCTRCPAFAACTSNFRITRKLF